MARNDIRFAQVQQADFSQANNMFKTAIDQTNQAFAVAEQTLKNFNNSVTARNDAVIKSFINSIPKEDWEHRQEDIQEFISRIADKSGNMYSAGAIEDYRDGRMDTLIARDNAQMKNYMANTEFGDYKDTEVAKELLAHSRTPEGARQVESLLDDIPDTIAYKYDELKLKSDVDRLRGLTDKNIATSDYNNSTIAEVDGIIQNAVNGLAESTVALQNARTPEEKEKLLKSYNASKHALERLTAQNPKGKNAISKMFNSAVDGIKKSNADQAKIGFEQEIKKQQLNLQRAKTEADIQNMAFKQALDSEKFAYDVANGTGNGSVKGSISKADAEVDKTLAKSGYPSKSDLTTDSPHLIRNAFQSNINSTMQAKMVELDSMNYNEWLHKENKNLPKYLTGRESFWHESRLTQLQSAFNAFAKAQGGRPLKDYEKIELTKIIANEQKGMNDWLTYKDNPVDFINRNLRNIEQKYQNEVVLAGRAKASEDINMLRKAYGLTDNQLLDIVLSGGGIGDTTSVLPESLLKGYIAHKRLPQPEQVKGKSEHKPKTESKDTPPKKEMKYLLSR